MELTAKHYKAILRQRINRLDRSTRGIDMGKRKSKVLTYTKDQKAAEPKEEIDTTPVALESGAFEIKAGRVLQERDVSRITVPRKIADALGLKRGQKVKCHIWPAED